MRTIITTLLCAITTLGIAQECALLLPDNVKIMGMERTHVTLDKVEAVTLPVVFHVVHTGDDELNNISDEQLLSQIDVLNSSFSNSSIQFCLAVRDPEGNPTNGITRYDASWNEEYVADGIARDNTQPGWSQVEMKQSAGCWNPDEYINIYSVSEIDGNDGGAGIQGFAYLGPTGDCRDGIVCLYNATGNVGELKSYTSEGLTGVHEMGHHLSLWHTFSNTSSCTSETNCETQGDQVCDTPPTTVNSYCSSSCPDALVNNFMDYTAESCKDSFTQGQAERMHSCIQDQRYGLVTSLACAPVVDYDATPAIAYYQETWCTPAQDIWIDVLNQGTEVMPILEVQLYCNGNQYTTTLFDVPVGITEVVFPAVYVDGAQQFEVQTISEFDEYADNDYAWWPIETTDGSVLEISVSTDIWANELEWLLYDQYNEVIMGDGDWAPGVQTFEYEMCVFNGCYTVEVLDDGGDGFCSIDFDGDGICDIGGQGIVGTIDNEVVFETGFGLQFDQWDSTFCVEIDPCPLDFDDDGVVGNSDVLILVSEFGCEEDCFTDPNNDGMVNVMDLIYMLSFIGECDIDQNLGMGMVKDLTIEAADAGGSLFGSNPHIYDMSGRRVKGPVENLASGVYILRWKDTTKKVFVQ